MYTRRRQNCSEQHRLMNKPVLTVDLVCLCFMDGMLLHYIGISSIEQTMSMISKAREPLYNHAASLHRNMGHCWLAKLLVIEKRMYPPKHSNHSTSPRHTHLGARNCSLDTRCSLRGNQFSGNQFIIFQLRLQWFRGNISPRRARTFTAMHSRSIQSNLSFADGL